MERRDEQQGEATGDGPPPADRSELLALLGAITETRLYRPTETEGWTLRHVLGAVAAADRVLAHVLEVLAAEPTTPKHFTLRRVRGEVMYNAHMRHREGLGKLIEETYAEAEKAISVHGWLLDLPIEVVGSDAMSAHDLLAERAQLERAAVRELRAVLPPGTRLA